MEVRVGLRERMSWKACLGWHIQLFILQQELRKFCRATSVGWLGCTAVDDPDEVDHYLCKSCLTPPVGTYLKGEKCAHVTCRIPIDGSLWSVSFRTDRSPVCAICMTYNRSCYRVRAGWCEWYSTCFLGWIWSVLHRSCRSYIILIQWQIWDLYDLLIHLVSCPMCGQM